MASESWRNEPKNVKRVYKQMAREIDRELNQRRQRNPRSSLVYVSIITPDNAIFTSERRSTRITQPSEIHFDNSFDRSFHLPNPSRFINAVVSDPNVTLAPEPTGYNLHNSENSEREPNSPIEPSLPTNISNTDETSLDWYFRDIDPLFRF